MVLSALVLASAIVPPLAHALALALAIALALGLERVISKDLRKGRARETSVTTSRDGDMKCESARVQSS